MVDWPGKDRQVAVLYLSVDEIQAAYRDARARFDRQSIPVDEHSALIIDQEWGIQQTHRMLFDPDVRDPKPEYRLFKNADEARRSLSINHLQHFTAIQSQLALDEYKEWNPEMDLRGQLIDLFDLEDPGNMAGLLDQFKELQVEIANYRALTGEDNG